MTEEQVQSMNRYDTLRILTRGRKSGLVHIAVVRFVFHDGAYYVLSGRTKSDWALNAIASRGAKLRIGDYLQEVSCEVCAEKKDETLALFAQRYGKSLVANWYRAAAYCLRLVPEGPRQFRGRIRGESEAKTDLSTWKEKNSDYYSAISTAFNSASEEYDFTISRNFINVWIRERSIRELLSITKPDDILLEIGCGTGAEAIQISKNVAGVVATDISPSMISLVQKKAKAWGLSERVFPMLLSASDVASSASILPKGMVRVAYSFNGALNCEPNIHEFPRQLSKIIEPDGFFLCSIRNTLCLSEAIIHAAVFQFDRMAPRKKQPVMVSVGGQDIPSFYYPPGKFAATFRPFFKVEKMIALPGLLPPAYLSDFYFKARKVLGLVERLENNLAGLYPLNRLGDQTLIVFKRSVQ